jgi:uncharacterized delta-60 repeat protein
MNACTALVPVRKVPAKGLVRLRQVLRQGSIDSALSSPPIAPQFQLEALEARRLLSGGFGDHGFTHVDFPGVTDGSTALPDVIAAAPDGKFYAGGGLYWSTIDGAIARFNADGSPDTTFGDGGTVRLSVLNQDFVTVDRMLVQSDGKLVVTAETPDGIAVTRLNTDGSIDTTFGGGPQLFDQFNDFPYEEITFEDAAWLTSDGKVMLMGMDGPNVLSMRLNSDGSLDQSYGAGGSVSTPIDANNDAIGEDNLMAAEPLVDGSVIAYANLWSRGQTPTGRWVDVQQLQQLRFDANGNLISQKAVNTGLAPGTLFYGDFPPDPTVILAPDGSAFVSQPAVATPIVAKLGVDGILDDTFGDQGLATSPGIYAEPTAVTNNGQLLVWAGKYDPYIWAEGDGMVRLNTNGSLDTSLNDGQPIGNGAYPAYPLADGSILLGYWGGGVSDAGTNNSSAFVIQKIPPTGQPQPDGLPGDPAALAAIARQQGSQDDLYQSLFDAANDATIWNPDGDGAVFGDPISAT